MTEKNEPTRAEIVEFLTMHNTYHEDYRPRLTAPKSLASSEGVGVPIPVVYGGARVPPKPLAQEFVREVEVTAEMRSLFHAICPTGPHTVDDDTLDRAYFAMHAAAPVEFTPDERIAELEAERDAYERQLTTTENLVFELKAEQARLHDLLAQRPAPVPDTPKPAPNPFRDFPSDPRRLGP